MRSKLILAEKQPIHDTFKSILTNPNQRNPICSLLQIRLSLSLVLGKPLFYLLQEESF